ncbi:MAG: hypothetical protein LBQ31_03385 [Bacteroidales bacterium]|jgi:hypothetical protein|nr:hypothetical protein [Bacteroidales bacterium]
MFDTVNFWIDRANILMGNPFDILPYLSEITERHNERQGYSYTGKLNNYTVSVFEGGISLKGSLSAYLHPSNIYTLKRNDTRQAIEKLSDNLHTDIGTAKVTRFDISTVIPTKRPPSDYYSHLGNKPYFTRLQSTPDTLYYNNHQRQLSFYDKAKEAKAKKTPIPDILQGCNLFRYELRFLKRLNEQFKRDITGNLLFDSDFYCKIVQWWYNEFKTINKNKNTILMADNNIKTPKQAETLLFACLLQEKGTSFIDDFISQLKTKSAFKERQRYYELRRKLFTISQNPKGQTDDLIKELETAIFDIAKYAR